MNKKLIPLVLLGAVAIGWAGITFIPNDNFGEGNHSSSQDSEEQVYFGTMGKDPMSVACVIVELPEHPTRVQTSAALAQASVSALHSCVAIRWVPDGEVK